MLACASCAASAPTVTVTEVGPQELPTVAPVASVSVAPPPQRRVECQPPPQTNCTQVARVRIDHVTLSSPTCVVDTQVKEGDVGKLMNCAGGSYVQFADAMFGGTFDGVNVNVCMKTEYPFSDGCTWQTMQRIVGRSDTSMRFSYGEHAISGRNCSPAPCRANAEIYVIP